MALIRPVQIENVIYPEAYSRITGIRVDKNDAYIFVCTYQSVDTRNADGFPIKADEYVTSRSTVEGDIYVAGYAYLKTLPDFANAVDHLEERLADVTISVPADPIQVP